MLIPVFDRFIARLNQALLQRVESFSHIATPRVGAFLTLLLRQGLINGFSIEEPNGVRLPLVIVYLKYHNGVPPFRGLQSKKGRRVISSIKLIEMKKLHARTKMQLFPLLVVESGGLFLTSTEAIAAGKSGNICGTLL
jgi:ribosomal protein S8